MANKYGNMHSFVKMHSENSGMKTMSHKKRYTPEFFGYIMNHNICSTQRDFNEIWQLSYKGHDASFTTKIMH